MRPAECVATRACAGHDENSTHGARVRLGGNLREGYRHAPSGCVCRFAVCGPYTVLIAFGVFRRPSFRGGMTPRFSLTLTMPACGDMIRRAVEEHKPRLNPRISAAATAPTVFMKSYIQPRTSLMKWVFITGSERQAYREAGSFEVIQLSFLDKPLFDVEDGLAIGVPVQPRA